VSILSSMFMPKMPSYQQPPMYYYDPYAQGGPSFTAITPGQPMGGSASPGPEQPQDGPAPMPSLGTEATTSFSPGPEAMQTAEKSATEQAPTESIMGAVGNKMGGMTAGMSAAQKYSDELNRRSV
jgi:hypothetical protein